MVFNSLELLVVLEWTMKNTVIDGHIISPIWLMSIGSYVGFTHMTGRCHVLLFLLMGASEKHDTNRNLISFWAWGFDHLKHACNHVRNLWLYYMRRLCGETSDSLHRDPDIWVRPSSTLYLQVGCLSILGEPLIILSSRIDFIRVWRKMTEEWMKSH